MKTEIKINVTPETVTEWMTNGINTLDSQDLMKGWAASAIMNYKTSSAITFIDPGYRGENWFGYFRWTADNGHRMKVGITYGMRPEAVMKAAMNPEDLDEDDE